MAPSPYRITPVFDQDTLPQALREEHRTKAGTWGLLRVLDGRVTLIFTGSGREMEVDPERPAPIPPEEPHKLRVEGAMRLQVEFYREPPISS